MTESPTVTYERRDAIALITFNRPDALNSFNKTMRAELAEALRRAEADDEARVVVLTGAGRAFSAGADLKAGFPEGDFTVEDQLQNEYRPSLRSITTMPKPVIAAVNGSAAGIGLSFALAADITVLADNAFLLSPFTTISLVGDGGANWLLVNQIGYRKAFELSILSERIDAETALALGLANRVVAADELESEVLSLAETIAGRAPLSIAATKKAMRFAATASYESTFDVEAKLQRELMGGEDNVEGVNAFLEKRAPAFKGVS